MTDYAAVSLEPELGQWPVRRAITTNIKLSRLRESARRRLLTTATTFTRRLSEHCGDCRIERPDEPPISLLSGDPQTTAIVMTGHQPVIFHSGLAFKYAITEHFAVTHQLIAVAVVIDTDAGDAGAFPFPVAEFNERTQQGDTRPTASEGAAASATGVAQPLIPMVTATASFGLNNGLYSTGKIKSSSELLAESEHVAASLISLGCVTEAETFRGIAQRYAGLRNVSMADANLIVRRSTGIGGRMLEVPLSSICEFPEVQEFSAELFAQPGEFALCYNSTLADFRAKNKIRNDANPFPNLQIDSDNCELPFWIVDPVKSTRTPLRVPKLEPCDPGSILTSQQQLVPRGALITAILRMLFSDLFVHGTGGARYDRYTDELIRAWWHTEPAPIALASASRHLFEKERRQLEQWQKLQEKIRDLQFNPQRYFDSGVFSPGLEESLKALETQKNVAVNRMKIARESRQSAVETGREIQQLSNTMKSLVAAEFEPQLIRLRELSAANIATLNSRTWPWFFFDQCPEDVGQTEFGSPPNSNFAE